MNKLQTVDEYCDLCNSMTEGELEVVQEAHDHPAKDMTPRGMYLAVTAYILGMKNKKADGQPIKTTKNRRKNLIRAAGLIISEINRLDEKEKANE
jgi:hypothetical protein